MRVCYASHALSLVNLSPSEEGKVGQTATDKPGRQKRGFLRDICRSREASPVPTTPQKQLAVLARLQTAATELRWQVGSMMSGCVSLTCSSAVNVCMMMNRLLLHRANCTLDRGTLPS